MNQKQEYLKMGLDLTPSGKINHHKWYCRKFDKGSTKDSTWKKGGSKSGCAGGYHACCGSKKAYCHNAGCKNRRELLGDDDYSDLKRIES